MAITYNINKCKEGWGVYVRALSGNDLLFFVPGCTDRSMRVTSGRLARKRSKQSAKNFVARLMQESVEERRRRLTNVWIKSAPRDYKIVKVQNLRLFREIDKNGKMIPTFVTHNREYIESVALYYAEREVETFLRKGVTKSLKLPLDTDVSNLNKL